MRGVLETGPDDVNIVNAWLTIDTIDEFSANNATGFIKVLQGNTHAMKPQQRALLNLVRDLFATRNFRVCDPSLFYRVRTSSWPCYLVLFLSYHQVRLIRRQMLTQYRPKGILLLNAKRWFRVSTAELLTPLIRLPFLHICSQFPVRDKPFRRQIQQIEDLTPWECVPHNKYI